MQHLIYGGKAQTKCMCPLRVVQSPERPVLSRAHLSSWGVHSKGWHPALERLQRVLEMKFSLKALTLPTRVLLKVALHDVMIKKKTSKHVVSCKYETMGRVYSICFRLTTDVKCWQKLLSMVGVLSLTLYHNLLNWFRQILINLILIQSGRNVLKD